VKFSSGRFVAVMASLLALAGCGLREEEAGSEVAEPVDWATCGDIECATIRVPLDHFAPEFKQAAHIELRAYRTVSEAAGSRHQTLVIHPGGPGADVRAAVARARTALAPIIDDFDIYALSTRGSVDGTAFDCGETLGDIRVIDAGVNAAERFAERCSEKSAELIGRIGTRQSVEDLEEFRSAIGVDRVRYLGRTLARFGRWFSTRLPIRAVRGLTSCRCATWLRPMPSHVARLRRCSTQWAIFVRLHLRANTSFTSRQHRR
jgi:pimeloyl-ACP methyl ester carboxylesterase